MPDPVRLALRAVRYAQFDRYTNSLKKHNMEYGIVRGSNEIYAFQREDEVVPPETFLWHRTYEKKHIDAFLKLTEDKFGKPKPGSYFMDIGANIGTTCIYVARNYSEPLNFIAFEPDPITHKVLKLNSVLNNCEYIKTENMGVSDRAGEMQMHIERDKPGCATILTDADARGEDIETVKVCRVDDYLRERSIDPASIHYVWMDVEGHESFVIGGMMETLRKHRPAMWMEFSTARRELGDERFDSLYENLSEIYDHVMVPDLADTKEYPLSFLKSVYRHSKHGYYDIFLF